jgi:hypothetical protein
MTLFQTLLMERLVTIQSGDMSYIPTVMTKHSFQDENKMTQQQVRKAMKEGFCVDRGVDNNSVTRLAINGMPPVSELALMFIKHLLP